MMTTNTTTNATVNTTNVNGVINVLDYDVYKAAFSNHDTWLVETSDDATILYKDGSVAVAEHSTAILDITYKKGKIYAWSVRDIEEGDHLAVGSLHTPAWFRQFCKKRGANIKYVCGGCRPINPVGFTCVDAFNMSGTEFYLVPDYVIAEFMNSNEEFRTQSRWG
jgi:hypothetical protein